MPEDHAQRVVARAPSGERMRAIQCSAARSLFRELLPQDLKIELETLAREQAMNIARFLEIERPVSSYGLSGWRRLMDLLP